MTNAYLISIEQIEKELETDRNRGLKKQIQDKNLKKYGTNSIKKLKKNNLFIKFINQFKDFMIIILIISAIISFITGQTTDALVILAIVITNAIIGLVQEGKAEKSLEALKKLATPKCRVIRNSKIDEIVSEDLVIGDIIVIETGDYVPADLRLFETINLQVLESSFTGESIPVEKQSVLLFGKNLPVTEQKNMAFASSYVVQGRAKGIAVATGMSTQIGNIAKYVQEDVIQDTPLKKRLDALGKVLGIAALSICAIIFLMGYIIYNLNILEIFLVAVSLAVAAIPEGLPTVATIVLAIGVQKMAKKKAIIRKLPSVETLGSTTVICSDKTGTLTQNIMEVKNIFVDFGLKNIEKNMKVNKTMEVLATACSACNDTKIRDDYTGKKMFGDPTEIALVELGYNLNIDKVKLDKVQVREFEVGFDSVRKCMSTVHRNEKGYVVYMKGGVDEILAKCTNILSDVKTLKLDKIYIESIKKANDTMTLNALRVLAVGYKQMEYLEKNSEKIEKDITFIGLVGMNDPPRKEAKEAIRKCKNAGIKTIMITGDHKNTAVQIAKELGILNIEDEAITGAEIDNMKETDFQSKVKKFSVYARVSPEHKVRIVKALKNSGEIVAMTGDGINDAPALRKADIGISMGNIGTDVAKEASDMILANDNFATIVSAVEEGRRIFDNITKAIIYLLSCNTGEVLTIFFAMLFGMSEPLLPIHILWINLVTDSFPALGLGVDPPEEDIMKRKPKKVTKTLFNKKNTIDIVYQGILISFVTLLAFYIGNKISLNMARTMAFSVLGFSQIFQSFNVHVNNKSIFSLKTFTNFYLILAATFSIILMLAVLIIPYFINLFKFEIVNLEIFTQIIIFSFIPSLILEFIKFTKKRVMYFSV